MDTANKVASLQENISVVYAEQEHVPAGRRYGPVIRSVYIIECCTAGKGAVIINGKTHRFTAGDCYVLLPGDSVVHITESDSHREGFWCALDGISIGSYLKSAGITSQSPFVPTELFPTMCQWLQQLVDEWPCRDAGARLRQTACAYAILGTLLKSKPAAVKSSLVEQAIGLMQVHYPEELSVAALANQVGLERTYFTELFKDRTGLSPYQYLKKLRIQKACQLLAQGHSVAETADLVGMESHNFCRVFRSEVSLSPREYLQRLRSNSNKVVARSVKADKE